MKRAAPLTALVLCACTGAKPPLPVASVVEAPASWRNGALSAGVAADRSWWRGFGDPVLDSLVERALAHNMDVAVAATRVEQARAQFRSVRSQQAPQVNAVGAGGRTRSLNPFGLPVEQWAGQGEVQAAFDLDLFGRLENASAAARAQLLASEYGREAVRRAVASAVASGYIALLTYDARLSVLQRTLETRAGALKLARRRAEAGYASRLDLSQAEAEYAAAEQLIPTIELAITKQENALSLLLDQPPGPIARGVTLDKLQLPQMPAELPSSLLRRRPDLLSAEAQIVAADRSLDSARAAFLPDIKLTAEGGFVASSLIGDPVSIFSLGGSILAPIFNGGRLKAQARGAAAKRDEAAYSYRRAVLSAFREVEDGLAANGRLIEQESALSRQRGALAQTQSLASNRYREGYSPFLEMLDAQRALLSAELALVQVRSDRLTNLVGLHHAFGIE